MTEFSWKHKILFGTIMALMHTILLFLINKISGDAPNLKSLFMQGFFMGLFFILLFPYIMKRTAKKLAKKVDILVKDIISSPEEIIYDGGANQILEKEGVGGKLFITNQRVLFISHKYNIQKGTTSIPLNNITSIEKNKVAKIFNTGITIILNDTTKYKFVVNNQDEWFNQLNSYIQVA